MLIRSTKNYGAGNLKMLVYGAPGVGKTSLAKTCPEKCLVVSVEGGLLSLADSDVDFIDVTLDDKGQVQTKEKRIEKLQEVFQFVQTEDAKKYKWIFIDSITEISQNIVDVFNIKFPDKKDSLVMYSEIAKETRSLIKNWRDLPGKSVVFTALSEIEKDEMGKRYQGIAMTGKISQQIPAYFDEVFYYHVYDSDDGKKNRILITQPTEKAIAKDRSGKLEIMEQPDLSIIAAKIKGQQDAGGRT